MSITTEAAQVQWSAADSKSVAASGAETSDAVSIPDAAFAGEITLKADNNGTPSSGDTITFKILYTCGDPDGSGSDEYDTDDNAPVVAVLDTNVDDPAIVTVKLTNIAAKGFKVYAKNNNASRAITVSAEARFKKSA
jgi:hypothetical protein